MKSGVSTSDSYSVSPGEGLLVCIGQMVSPQTTLHTRIPLWYFKTSYETNSRFRQRYAGELILDLLAIS